MESIASMVYLSLVEVLDPFGDFFHDLRRLVDVDLMSCAIDEHDFRPLDLFMHRLLITNIRLFTA